MKDLYIVSTYYHALIACVKQLQSEKKSDLIVTDYIPQKEMLAKKLCESGIFEIVRCVGEICEYTPKNKLDYIFNLHSKNAEIIKMQLDFSIGEYDEIYIFHDNTWFAHYLKCEKIPYNLIEDALDSYKRISKSPFKYMLHKADLKAWIKNIFRIGYVFCGYDRFAKSVEVNSIDGVEIKQLAGKKLVEIPRKPMFDRLTALDLDKLKFIFFKDIPEFDYRNSVLLITQPLFEDGIVIGDDEQIVIYKRLAAKYSRGYSLVIKPHPRDTVDYSVVFPNAVILNKNMPLEIVGLIEKPHFARVVSFGSSCQMTVDANEFIVEGEI